jgi:putative transposase
VEFIRTHHGRRDHGGLVWGVEPICRVLTEHGLPIAPSTYYEQLDRTPTRREVRDEQLKTLITKVHANNYGVYGARKVWLQLNRERLVDGLMGDLGLAGAIRGKVKRTTVADPTAKRPGDLIGRQFTPLAPDRLWVADFTYVSTWAGWVYVAFVIDAYARRIIGWRSSTSMTAQLVLDAIEHAVWTRGRQGRQIAGVIQHHDHGSQYTSVAYSERLAADEIRPSMGVVGSSYDNALAETINGLYKTELIKARGPWRTIDQVEVATAEWVDWFNHRRLYEYCGDIPPADMEAAHYAQLRVQQPAELSHF